MDKTRTTRQTSKSDELPATGLTMISTRIDDELSKYIRNLAFHTRKSK